VKVPNVGLETALALVGHHHHGIAPQAPAPLTDGRGTPCPVVHTLRKTGPAQVSAYGHGR
jgi:hypothetical protein